MAKRDVVTLDDAIFQKKIRDLARRVKVDEKEFVREQGGLFMRDVAKFVPPYKNYPSGRGTKMGTKKDQRQGEFAVAYDIMKLFFVPDKPDVYEAARKNFPNGPIYKGRKLIGAGVANTLSKMEAHHRRHMTQRGRTYKLKGPQKMWTSENLLVEYIQKQRESVGMAKSAPAKVAVKLDRTRAKDVPAWVKRHLPTAKGSGRMAQIRGSWSAIMKASASGLQHVRSDMLDRIKRGRLKAMESRLLYIAKDNAKKAGFAVK